MKRRDPSLKKIYVASDIHFPEHDKVIWNKFLKVLKDSPPDELILLGDIGDLESCSSHGGNPDPPALADDVRAINKGLDEIQAVYKGDITYMFGNHEYRAERAVTALAPALWGVFHLKDLLRLKQRGITYAPYGSVINRGKLSLTHGWLAGQNPAKAHLDSAQHSIMVGHVHRPGIYTRGTLGGKVQAGFVLPCMVKLDAPYLHGKPSGWTHGFGVVYVDKRSGDFYTYLVMATRRCFVWDGRRY